LVCLCEGERKEMGEPPLFLLLEPESEVFGNGV